MRKKFLDKLREEIKKSHDEMKINWNRMLPSNEMLMDRWEKAKMLGFGDGSSIYDSSIVLGNVEVGNNVWIGPFTLLDGSGGLSIGLGTHISAGVQIYSHDTVKQALSSGNEEIERTKTTIGSNCHIGAGAIILKGVKIGDHCVVGAGCVVTKSFPSHSVILGVPGKQTGYVEIDNIDSVSFKYID